jgi:hypothetical protein
MQAPRARQLVASSTAPMNTSQTPGRDSTTSASPRQTGGHAVIASSAKFSWRPGAWSDRPASGRTAVGVCECSYVPKAGEELPALRQAGIDVRIPLRECRCRAVRAHSAASLGSGTAGVRGRSAWPGHHTRRPMSVVRLGEKNMAITNPASAIPQDTANPSWERIVFLARVSEANVPARISPAAPIGRPGVLECDGGSRWWWSGGPVTWQSPRPRPRSTVLLPATDDLDSRRFTRRPLTAEALAWAMVGRRGEPDLNRQCRDSRLSV